MSAIDEYLAQFRKFNTRDFYKKAIKNFLLFVYGEGELGILSDRYIAERNDSETRRDLTAWWSSLNSYAPTTQHSYLSVVKGFLIDFAKSPPDRFWVKFRRRGRKPKSIAEEHIPTSADLRRIIAHLPVHAKAIFVFLAASGARINEAMSMHIEDLELNVNPPRVFLPAEITKNREDRKVFFTHEAKEYIQEWLKIRSSYIQSNPRLSDIEDPELFPQSPHAARSSWNLALSKTGLDEKCETTNRHLCHPHTLRKRFRTQLASVIPLDVVEVLIGHQGYLTGAYRKYTEDELASFYLQGQHVLIISEDRARVEEIAKQSHESERERKQLQERVEELESRIAKMKREKIQNETDLRKTILSVLKEKEKEKGEATKPL